MIMTHRDQMMHYMVHGDLCVVSLHSRLHFDKVKKDAPYKNQDEIQGHGHGGKGG